MPDPTPGPDACRDVDPAKLALAIRAVISCGRPAPDGTRRPLYQIEVCREAGVAKSDLSKLLNHREPMCSADTIRLLSWLNMSPRYFAPDPPAAGLTPAAADPAHPAAEAA